MSFLPITPIQQLEHVKFDPGLADPGPKQDVTYKLFTVEDQENEKVVTEEDIASRAADIPTVLLIHGWTSSDSSPWYSPMRNEYFKLGYNVIYVNWFKAANKGYRVSCANVKPVGKYVAEFLRASNLSPANIHLIGHSLGAMLSAHIGKEYQILVGQKIGRITALDPAGPLWNKPEINREDLIHPDDAHFVDVVHTDITLYGYAKPLGHVDFYPNGGKFQPGCPDEEQKENCSHHRSTRFFIESIHTKMHAIEADFEEDVDVEHAVKEKANGKRVIFGHHVDRSIRGVFHFKTNSQIPFLKLQD